MIKIFNRFLVFVNITLVVLTIGAYIAPYFHPNDAGLLAILGLGFPALLMANITFILYWIIVKIKYSLVSGLTLLIGFTPLLNIINLNTNTSFKKDTSVISIANYNMQFLKPVQQKNDRFKTITEKDFLSHLEKFQHIDVLCLQEHSTYAQKHIKKKLNFPYKFFSKGKFVAIYSKFPILDKGQLEKFSSNKANVCLWADIEVHGKKIRVYTAHFESNRKDGKIPTIIDTKTKEPPIDFSMAVGLLQHYQQFTSKRVAQSTRLQQLFKASPHPFIFCGDVNDTPQTHVYKLLKEGLKDTFWEKGIGLGATFGSTLKNKLALLRIDYILTHPEFNILNHQIYPALFSDHYLISSSIQLP